MKRSALLIITLMLIIVLISFASASWWNKITGRAVDNPCEDSDQGENYFKKGVLEKDDTIKTDYCWNIDEVDDEYLNVLREYSCKLNQNPLNPNIIGFGGPDDIGYYEINYDCPNGCKDGACILPQCKDSDNGLNFYLFGFAEYDNNKYDDWCSINKGNGGKVDKCSGEECDLIEIVCDDNTGGVNYKIFNCPIGCKEGSCVIPECADSDSGEDYFNKGKLNGFSMNHGLVELEDFCIDRTNSLNGEVVFECSGSKCKLGERVCDPSQDNVGDYVTRYYNCPDGCKDGKCITTQENQTDLIYDEDSGIYMEEIVLNKIEDIRIRAKICGDCVNLPQPIISLNNGDKEAIYNLYLNDKKVTKFPLPFFNVENQIIENPNNVLIETFGIDVDGTNKIKFLIPAEGNYFQNRYDILKLNEGININYEIVKKEGDYGSAYFFILENDEIFNLDNIVQNFDDIAKDHSNLAGLEVINPYYIIAMPSIFALLLGGEGNYYFSNHLITMNYGGEKYYELYNKEIFNNEQGHEYVHGLQETFSLYQKYKNGVFLMEGMADTITIYNGYKKWEQVGPFVDEIEPGCSYLPNPTIPHTLGRCIFKHLDQNNYLNDDFFYKLFHPENEYELIECSRQPSGEWIPDLTLQNPDCVEELNKLLTYLTGDDMTLFMKEELLANISLEDVIMDKSLQTNDGGREVDECPQLGFREGSRYCSIGDKWLEQKGAESVCENNFECSSNLCFDGQCVSGSLWQKFLRWLSKLFG